MLRDRWRNLRDRFGPSKNLKKNTGHTYENRELRSGTISFLQELRSPDVTYPETKTSRKMSGARAVM